MRGVLAAALTPLKADLSVDHDAFAAHCRWLLERGCDGLAVMGSTGEANSFSLVERLDLLERLAAAGLPPRKLLPGTGCCALPDTVVLSKQAVELGCAGVLVLPPFYYKTVTDEGLFASYAQVIEKVADPRLRLYLYHFPQMSGIALSHALVERLRQAYPGTVVGIKDSSGDLANMLAMIEKFPDLAVFAGSDALLKPVLEAGGAGCITAIANLISPLLARVFAGDFAAQDTVVAIRQAFEGRPLVGSLKGVMALLTEREEWKICRPPHMPLDVQDLLEEIKASGFVPC